MSQAKDLSGTYIGSILIVCKKGLVVRGKKQRKEILWECQCYCGKLFKATAYKLKTGQVKSCGCLKRIYIKGVIQLNRKPILQLASTNRIAQYKRGAKTRNIAWNLTDNEAWALMQDNCHYCGVPPCLPFKRQRANYRPNQNVDSINCNGIDRVDSNIGYSIGNVVSCCAICNYAKGTKTQAEFFEWVAKIYKNLIKKDLL